MVMETSPGTAFKVIQAQVVLGALKVLLDMPTGTAQLQASRFGRRSVKMSQVIMIRLGVAGGPVHHQPNLFQFSPSMAQVMLQKDLVPSQAGPAGFSSRRHPRAVFPFRWGEGSSPLHQRPRAWRLRADVAPRSFQLRLHLLIRSLVLVGIHLEEELLIQPAHPRTKFGVVPVSAIAQNGSRRHAIGP